MKISANKFVHFISQILIEFDILLNNSDVFVEMRFKKSLVKILAVLTLFTATAVFAETDNFNQCEKALWYVKEGNKFIYGEPTKAEALYCDALERCPISANINYNLGISLYNQGKFSEAVSVLEIVLQINTEHKKAQRMLAYILIKEKIDPVRGKMLAEKLLEKNPDDKGAQKVIMFALTESLTVDSTSNEKAQERQMTPLFTSIPEIDTAIPKTNISNRNAIAVVIGNKDYFDKDIPTVEYAFKDADTIKKYLINVFGYRKGNIIYAPNATKAKFESIFGTENNYKGRLYGYLKKGKSDIFIYYTGHGAPGGLANSKGYFIPADVDPQAISLTGYSLQQLYDNVAKIARDMKSPNVLIMVDACFSGATEKGMLLKNMSPISIEIENPFIKMPNAVVMTSSSGSEISSWYPEKGHSMFTYFFLKALKEEVEKEKISEITAGRLFNIISDETEGVPYYARRLHGRIQTPQIMGDKNRLLLKK